MTKSYPKDIKGVRPKRMLSRELVQAGLDVTGREPVAVATRPEARGRAVRTVLTTDSPTGHQYVSTSPWPSSWPRCWLPS